MRCHFDDIPFPSLAGRFDFCRKKKTGRKLFAHFIDEIVCSIAHFAKCSPTISAQFNARYAIFALTSMVPHAGASIFIFIWFVSHYHSRCECLHSTHWFCVCVCGAILRIFRVNDAHHFWWKSLLNWTILQAHGARCLTTNWKLFNATRSQSKSYLKVEKYLQTRRIGASGVVSLSSSPSASQRPYNSNNIVFEFGSNRRRSKEWKINLIDFIFFSRNLQNTFRSID